MSKWLETTLGDVLRLEYGKALPERERDGQGSPVYGSNGIVGYHSIPLVRGPGIVVGRKGSAGSVQLCESDFSPIDTAYWVRLLSSNFEVELHYVWLLLQQADLPNLRAQTGVPGLNRERVYALRVTLPCLPEQKRIIAVMAAVDTQVAALEGEVTSLSAFRANLLLDILSNSDATSRALHEVIAKDIQTVQVVDDEAYPIVGVLNRGRGLLRREPIRGSDTAYKTLNVIRPSQIVYSRLKAFEGAITVSPRDMPTGYASGEFPTFTCGPELLPDYFALITRTPSLWERLQSLSIGMGGRRERVNPSAFLSIHIKIPTMDEQRTAAEVVAAVDETVFALTDELATLRRVRTDLLNALLSQEITVDKAVDQFIGAAA